MNVNMKEILSNYAYENNHKVNTIKEHTSYKSTLNSHVNNIWISYHHVTLKNINKYIAAYNDYKYKSKEKLSDISHSYKDILNDIHTIDYSTTLENINEIYLNFKYTLPYVFKDYIHFD